MVNAMKTIGYLMLPAGWFLVVAALAMLRTFAAQSLFVAAGVGVEIMGLVLFTRAHFVLRRGQQ